MKILLIEDNIFDVFLVEEAIYELEAGHLLESVRDGVSALKKIMETPPKKGNDKYGLILLDINIPKPNGRELLKIIKKNPDYKDIPVVILTSSIDRKDIQYAYENDVNAFVSKPEDLGDFFKCVKSLVDYWDVYQMASRFGFQKAYQ